MNQPYRALQAGLLCIALLLVGIVAPSHAAQSQPGSQTNQLIITYRAGQDLSEGNTVQRESRMDSLSRAAGVRLTYVRRMSGERQHVVRLPRRMALDEVERIAQRLRTTPTVLAVEPDERVYPMLAPNDPRYGEQWHYGLPAPKFGANLEAAWDITTGSANLVVAIIDSGVRLDHEDMVGRSSAGNPGYDMIDDVLTANDGDGRDSDPSDPGDWVTTTEAFDPDSFFFGCDPADSSWHGTHVAGTIGANGNNNIGVAGINWNSKLLYVRALGKCGGFTSDTADSIRWAAGLPVPGVPFNTTPARVINMSLGGGSACSTISQNAINDAVGAGATIVVAAGNSDAPVASPASCNNVIAIAATGPTGQKASYSNFGPEVDLSAPGGDQSTFNTTDGVLSTINTGTEGPAASSYVYYQGTSMATPHVAGVASLMLSANPSLTPAQIESLLKANVTPFAAGGPATVNCTTSTCGTGILNAGAAVQAALNTLAFTNGAPPNARPNVPYSFTFTASGNPAPTFSIGGALPSGLAFNTATGVLSGTPALLTGGSYPLTVTASNGVGLDAVYSFTLVVQGSYAFLPFVSH
jgi:serine protease